MNTNFLRKDGFSKSETKRLFDECWVDDALSDEHCTALCGFAPTASSSIHPTLTGFSASIGMVRTPSKQ
ncbi:MAG: hypothetical protein AB9869_19405 [Verrucomicrobiia bacterium]